MPMRIREFLPENWWKDLDPGFLAMMGYSDETQAPEIDTKSEISQEVKAIRHHP